MISGTTSIVLISSVGVMVFLIVLRVIESRFRFSLFGTFDPFVQRLVTYASIIVLRCSTFIKEFLLVHVYHVSSATTKGLLKRSKEKKESLLNALGGTAPRASEKNNNENVSPFLKEISRVDREEE